MALESRHSQDVEGGLRSLLATDARAAPMPDHVLEIPRSWVRSPGRGRGGQLLGAFAAVAAIAAGISIVMLASQFERPPRVLTIGAAALIAGIPQEQMLQTSDGFVGVRAPTAAEPGVALVLVPVGGGPPRTLGVHTMSNFGDPTRDAFAVLTLSCAAGTGLVQPNFIFGFVQLHGTPTAALDVQPPIGHGAVANGVFVYVLDAKPPGTVLQLELRWASRPGLSPDWEATTARKTWQFDRLDPCNGDTVPER